MFDKIKDYFSQEQQEDRRIKELQKLEKQKELASAQLELEKEKSQLTQLKHDIKKERTKRIKTTLAPILNAMDKMTRVSSGIVTETANQKNNPLSNTIHKGFEPTIDVNKNKRTLTNDIHGD